MSARCMPALLAAVGLLAMGARAAHAQEPSDAGETAEALDAELPEPVRYDLSDSRLAVEVRPVKGLVSDLSRPVAVQATEVVGAFTWDPVDPEACELDVRVPVQGLAIDPPELRAELGMDGETPAKLREAIRGEMLGRDQLHADRFAEIRFKARQCSGAGERITVRGELTVRGHTRAVAMPATFEQGEEAFSLDGRIALRATEHGFQPWTAMFGAIENDDRMTLHVKLAGPRR